MTDGCFNIEGFPDGVKVIAINGPKAKRLADLSLHKSDLEFSYECLQAINLAPEEPYVFREALWRSALVHFCKCFGSDTRAQLNQKKIYKGEPEAVFTVFSYFKNLRDKHFIHDENAYSQSIPGAILNNGNKAYKIEKILCFSAHCVTLDQSHYSNLMLLVQKAQFWVDTEFDLLANTLTTDLEKEGYETLLAQKSVNYQVPTTDDISRAKK